MKKINLLFSVLTLISCIKLSGQIQQDCNGNIGIGGSSSNKLYVNGTTYLGSNLGVGVAPGSYRLYVNGTSYLNSSVGIGVAPNGSYKLYVSGGNTYLDSNVGIGVAPGSSYKLDVNGNSKIKGQLLIHSGTFYPDVYYFRFAADGPAPVPSLAPSVNGMGWIGVSSSAFNEVWSYHHYTPSDARQKENIRDIENPLDIVLNLKGVKYDIKKEYAFDVSKIKDETIKEKLDEKRKNEIGCIAQDMYKVLPEACVYDDSTDMYGIDYSKVVPVLIEAIKELSNELETLKSGGKLKSAEVPTGTEEINETGQPYLEQNVPNPFSETTTINFYLPNETGNALLNIYDLQGLQIKSYSISERGSSSVIINGSELKPGMYLYTLIADGQVISTKQMILTD